MLEYREALREEVRPYYVLGQKRAWPTNEYLLSDRCADLAILMTGRLKSEHYIRKRILKYLVFDQVLNG